MTGPLDSQYLVLDEMVARYGDDRVRAALLDEMALPLDILPSEGSAADALDMLTFPDDVDAVLEALARELPVDVDESDNDAVADEQRVQR